MKKRVHILIAFMLLTLGAFAQRIGIYPQATASGTDTYTATVSSPGPTTYEAGQRFHILFTNANTGAATININGLGAKSIVKSGSTALSAGDIAAGEVKFLAYDGTNMQIVGGSGSGGADAWTTSGTTTLDEPIIEIGNGLEFQQNGESVLKFWSDFSAELYAGAILHGVDFQDYVRFSIGSDATYDMYYRGPSSGNLTRIPIGTSGQYLGITAGVPTWGNPVALTARTGTSIAFDANARYGTLAFPETGNITFNSSGAVVGQVVTLIHNSSSEPTWGSEFDIISGAYVTDADNKIMMLLVETGVVWVTISQSVE